MLGSTQDAEDALQEALLAAWRGLKGFEGRSSLRAWLYRICTNACLRAIERRPKRLLTPDYGPPSEQTEELGEPVLGPIWLEPWIDQEPVDTSSGSDPAVRLLEREGVELAFVAALQHLPGTQRGVLILREVLGYSAAEVAEMLDTTLASVNSAMQRARQAVEERVPRRSQQAELADLGEEGVRALVDAFVAAWERADMAALVDLLAEWRRSAEAAGHHAQTSQPGIAGPRPNARDSRSCGESGSAPGGQWQSRRLDSRSRPRPDAHHGVSCARGVDRLGRARDRSG